MVLYAFTLFSILTSSSLSGEITVSVIKIRMMTQSKITKENLNIRKKNPNIECTQTIILSEFRLVPKIHNELQSCLFHPQLTFSMPY